MHTHIKSTRDHRVTHGHDGQTGNGYISPCTSVVVETIVVAVMASSAKHPNSQNTKEDTPARIALHTQE